jgi:hypothetical protein
MNPAALAVEGRSWARAARRRIEAAQVPFKSPIEEPDRLTDLGQAIEAIDRALRYANRIADSVSGTSVPAGPDWPRIKKVARRGRDALAHGDEEAHRSGLRIPPEPGPRICPPVRQG